MGSDFLFQNSNVCLQCADLICFSKLKFKLLVLQVQFQLSCGAAVLLPAGKLLFFLCESDNFYYKVEDKQTKLNSQVHINRIYFCERYANLSLLCCVCSSDHLLKLLFFTLGYVYICFHPQMSCSNRQVGCLRRRATCSKCATDMKLAFLKQCWVAF